MNWLLLRGEVPKDRDPREIIFNSIEESDDTWSLFFYNLLKNGDRGEIWYYNGPYKEHKLSSNLIERWIISFKTYDSGFVPDVIFCRGGFKEYHNVLKKFPKAIKIYYGAGRRFLPQPGFSDYNIILQDSLEQLKKCRKIFPNIPSTLFIKPAPDNLFYPMPQVKKEYDICFPANAAQAFKGHQFVYKTVPKNIKLLNLGNKSDRFKHPNNVTSYRVLRTEMPKHIAKCKVGIVAVESKIDSCPRVIPEMLACGLPIVVLNRVRFWQSKYIKSVVDSSSQDSTGELATKENFWDIVKYVLNNLDKYNPRKYYKENLSLEIAAKFLRGKIDEVRI